MVGSSSYVAHRVVGSVAVSLARRWPVPLAVRAVADVDYQDTKTLVSTGSIPDGEPDRPSVAAPPSD